MLLFVYWNVQGFSEQLPDVMKPSEDRMLLTEWTSHRAVVYLYSKCRRLFYLPGEGAKHERKILPMQCEKSIISYTSFLVKCLFRQWQQY